MNVIAMEIQMHDSQVRTYTSMIRDYESEMRRLRRDNRDTREVQGQIDHARSMIAEHSERSQELRRELDNLNMITSVHGRWAGH